MNEAWLEHQLTDEEAARFERDGYLVIPGALTADHVARLSAAVDRCRDYVTAELGVPRGDLFNLLDFVGMDDAFFELIDHPTTFPKLWRILGWNLQIYHTHMIVAPPAQALDAGAKHFVQRDHPAWGRVRPVASPEDWWGWHRDSGQVNGDLGTGPAPRLSVKFAYYLSDARGDADGNMWVVPGSHVDPEILQGGGHRKETPPGATLVHVAAGDAVLFDRRIVHSSSPNRGAEIRKVLFYGYSYRWVRPRDEMTVEGLMDRCTPIQRQLLGFSHSVHGYTSPSPEDVPLRAWLEEHGCAVAT